VSLGYPQEILEFEYDPSFPVRFVKNMDVIPDVRTLHVHSYYTYR
jgi:hypothetical protein